MGEAAGGAVLGQGDESKAADLGHGKLGFRASPHGCDPRVAKGVLGSSWAGAQAQQGAAGSGAAKLCRASSSGSGTTRYRTIPPGDIPSVVMPHHSCLIINNP